MQALDDTKICNCAVVAFPYGDGVMNVIGNATIKKGRTILRPKRPEVKEWLPAGGRVEISASRALSA
jgi:hypothetical protein